MKIASTLAVMSLFAATPALGQSSTMDAAELAHALDRLSTTGRVLYVAAHPDDENTRLLGFLANGRHYAATYLSMTRGGGGQNLIGAEKDELLDVIRTDELLAARRLDGAMQRFTRMRDFGYSKTAAETLAVWGHDEALADVVWVIRSYRPDVVITRFDEQPPNHGHHTASAILAREAFEAAGDPTKYPEQLSLGVTPWKPARLLHNVPTWREGPPPKGALELDVGAYDPRLGLSYGELAAKSRSQHKSQGFGVPGERGPLIERFLWLAGSKPEKDPFDGLELGWSRHGRAGAAFAEGIEGARARLDRDHPERALGDLLRAHQLLDAVEDGPAKRDARVLLDRVIASASGVFARATASKPGAVPGSAQPIKLEVLARRPVDVSLARVTWPTDQVADVGAKLAPNEKKELSKEVTIPADARPSAPYWLEEQSLPGRQVVRDPRLVGEPLGPPPLAASVELQYPARNEVGARSVRLVVPVEYAWTDQVHGERLRRFLVMPPATITPERRAVMFPSGGSGKGGNKTPVMLRVRAAKDALKGTVALELPAGWRVEPAKLEVSLAKAGDESTVRFEVTPPRDAKRIEVRPTIEVDGKRWGWRADVIDYPHIPHETVLQTARMDFVPLALEHTKGLVGYVDGSGDSVAEDLAHVGVRVEKIDDEHLRSGDLSRYAAIIVGIRAYNVRASMREGHARLAKYAEGGGTVIVQYVTNNRLASLDVPVGPFPIEIGRDRVTDETAAMVAIDPKSPVLTTPNKLGADDWAGWVQERGLYFAAKWDAAKWQPVFRIADPNEAPLEGALLVAKPGKGRWIYTGLGFFRQLPAGVPGAYRLLANLIGK